MDREGRTAVEVHSGDLAGAWPDRYVTAYCQRLEVRHEYYGLPGLIEE